MISKPVKVELSNSLGTLSVPKVTGTNPAGYIYIHFEFSDFLSLLTAQRSPYK